MTRASPLLPQEIAKKAQYHSGMRQRRHLIISRRGVVIVVVVGSGPKVDSLRTLNSKPGK